MALLWVALTALGEVVVLNATLQPPVLSDRGEEIDAAFQFLMVMGMPVLALVVAVVGYSVLRFRHRGAGDTAPPAADGPPIYGRGRVPIAWFGVTSALTLAVMIYPGLTGIPRVFAPFAEPDLVVEVEAFQWAWRVRYPEHGVESLEELVLPVDQAITFQITSRDVLHSFWVPAFRMKIDAVPGLTTAMHLRATTVGSFETDTGLRVQCAELCGVAHGTMVMPVRVVSADEFATWLADQGGTP